jgi:PTH1 family peptidyl-tRNA hydrolase
MTDRYLIVGLGNPGKEFAQNRHNIGFRIVDHIAAAYGGMTFSKKQSKALVADGTIADRKVLLAKPQTFMNLSGDSVQGLLAFYKIPLSNLLVIADDIDIPLGTIRIREKGGAGGQKGIKNTIERLGTQEFARMRIGVSRPPGKKEAADYVLQDFAKSEEILVIETVDRAVRAVETWLRHGLVIMMTRHNGTADEAARNASALPPKSQPEPRQETHPEPQPDTPN